MCTCFFTAISALLFLQSATAMTVADLRHCLENEAGQCHRGCSTGAGGQASGPLVECYKRDKNVVFDELLQCANRYGLHVDDNTQCWPVQIESPIQNSNGASQIIPVWAYLECMSVCMTTKDTCMHLCHARPPDNAGVLDQCKPEVEDSFRKHLFMCLTQGRRK